MHCRAPYMCTPCTAQLDLQLDDALLSLPDAAGHSCGSPCPDVSGRCSMEPAAAAVPAHRRHLPASCLSRSASQSGKAVLDRHHDAVCCCAPSLPCSPGCPAQHPQPAMAQSLALPPPPWPQQVRPALLHWPAYWPHNLLWAGWAGLCTCVSVGLQRLRAVWMPPRHVCIWRLPPLLHDAVRRCALSLPCSPGCPAQHPQPAMAQSLALPPPPWPQQVRPALLHWPAYWPHNLLWAGWAGLCTCVSVGLQQLASCPVGPHGAAQPGCLHRHRCRRLYPSIPCVVSSSPLPCHR